LNTLTLILTLAHEFAMQFYCHISLASYSLVFKTSEYKLSIVKAQKWS